MEAIENQVFESVALVMDGRSFVNCTISNCELRYSGGPFQMVGTRVSGCRWAFGGPARRTMEVLDTFNVLGGDGEAEMGNAFPSSTGLVN